MPFSLQEMYDMLAKLETFDPKYYLRENPDVAALDLDPLKHYIEFGSREGRAPTPYFDPHEYLRLNPDVEVAGVEPFFHYSVQGINENRKISSPLSKRPPLDPDVPSSAVFDTEFYLRTYQDVAAAGLDPEWHYIQNGEKEGRRPNKLFDPKFYARVNPDVAATGINLFDHFRVSGWREGRLASDPANELASFKRDRNILFLGHDAIQAGAQRVLADIIKWFSLHTDYRIYLILSDVGAMISEYAKYAETYVFYNYHVEIDDRISGLLKVKFDFVYVNTVRSGVSANLIIDKLVHKPRVISHLHELNNVIEQFPDDMAALSMLTDHFIVVNKEIKAYIHARHGISEEAISVEHPFITASCRETDPVASLREGARGRLNIPLRAFVVAGCGTAYSRKGLDIFVEAGLKTLRRFDRSDILFIWFGAGEDLEAAKKAVSDAGAASHFAFPGHMPDANRLLACADVFVLSSREDPFPLVCLEAAQFGAPTIHFDRGTSIGAFVRADAPEEAAGLEVAAFSPGAIAEAVGVLFQSPELRDRLGRRARARLFSDFEAEKKLLALWIKLARADYCSPSISVVVPNYNHEKYLHRRLDSVVNQSVKSIDIVILDDASTDGSRQVIERYADDTRVRTVYNAANSGSPFRQWAKGLALAKADIIWIAESDDFADVDFCKNLIGFFADPMVAIAVGKTNVVDSSGDIVVGALDPYFARAETNLFHGSWVRDGVEFVRSHFGVSCTLVNASGLLMSKSALQPVISHASDFKMCGDWLLYLMMLTQARKVAFSEGASNYFRRHETSAVHRIEGTPTYFNERGAIASYVAREFYLSRANAKRIANELKSEWERFAYKNPGRMFEEFVDERQLLSAAKMRQGVVALYVHGMRFSKGGIERVAAQLCKKLVEVGYKTIVYCSDLMSGTPMYPLPQNVVVKPVNLHDPGGVDNCASMLRKDGVDVFIPMLSEALFEGAIEAGLRAGVKMIASEHNDPWQIEKKWWSPSGRLRRFAQVDRIHLLLPMFRRSLPEALQSRVVTIANGIEMGSNFEAQSTCEPRRIVCVARLSAQKRIDFLIDAFASRPSRLADWTVDVFGDGELRDALAQRIVDKRVADHFRLRGLTEDVHAELVNAAMFVLPSEFEGLGIVVLEAQRAGLPCVAFKDCNGPNQLIEHGVNGLLASEMSAEGLGREMETLMDDAPLRREMGRRARASCGRYALEGIMARWIEVIDGLLYAETPIARIG